MSQGFVKQAPIYTGYTAPTRQIFTSGSGTYTKPAGVLYIDVQLVGGGGGGAGSGSVAGSAPGTGGNTTFSTLTANGGSAASFFTPGSGGGASGGDYNLAGGGGGASMQLETSITGANQTNGGTGGNSVFGGGAKGGAIGGGTGQSAAANTGGGGSGGGTINTANIVGGAGGGAGGYARGIITNPASTYSYSVGAGGAAGTAGTSGYAGGAGAAGIIIVTEYYQLNTYGELIEFPLGISQGGTGLTSTNPVIQRKSVELATTSGTTTIPFDNTVPQNTEGFEIGTLSITPKNASNILVITCNTNLSYTAGSGYLSACLFQDSNANCIAAGYDYSTTANGGANPGFQYVVAAGTTSSTTFKVRVGASGVGTVTVNGQSGGQIYGGALRSVLTITEITP